jgi:predicted esterase
MILKKIRTWQTFIIFILIANLGIWGQTSAETIQKSSKLADLLFEVTAQKIKKQITPEIQKNPLYKPWFHHIKYDISSYRITYQTTYQGKTISASGAVVLPKDYSTPRPLLVWLHGTSFDKNNAPSMWKFPRSETLPAMSGFITLLPDYIGYGYSAGGVLHPYMRQKPGVTTVIDLIKSGKKILDANNIKYTGHLFVSGYSQGGHITLSVLKELEQNPISGIKITAAAPAGSPYKLKENLEFILKHEKFDHIGYVAFLIASYNENSWKRPYSYFFKDPYAGIIKEFTQGKISLLEMRKSLTSRVKELMNPVFLNNYLGKGELEVKKAFQDNCDFNWVPETPLVMFHGRFDQDVPYNTAKETYDQFIERGADPDKIKFVTIEKGNHDIAGMLSLPMILDYFTGFLE